MGDRKDAMDGNPKARGGRRRQKLDKDKYPPSRLAGLKHFQPGQSGNKGGRPRQHHEAVAFLRGNMELIQAAMMDIVERGLQGKLTASDKILSSHLEFIWQAAFGRHPQSVLIGGGLDIGNPEDTGGVTALLARARLESERRTARRLESRPDFIASPTGEISAAPPPSPVESAARIGELYQVAVAAMEGAPATESRHRLKMSLRRHKTPRQALTLPRRRPSSPSRTRHRSRSPRRSQRRRPPFRMARPRVTPNS